MQGNPVYKFFSALLCYPEAELVEALPEFQAALDQMPELAAHREGLHALYIFEHVFGEDRDRGSAMVDLLEEYRKYGFELGDDELPDFLPALLEFFAHIPPADAQKLLGDAVHVINHIGKNLRTAGSPYAGVLENIVALSPVEPQPLTEPPVRDMDEAMETFGPDVSGIEPLLKPSIQTVQFYPKSK